MPGIIVASLKGDQKAAQTIDWFIDITSAPLAVVVNVTGYHRTCRR